MWDKTPQFTDVKSQMPACEADKVLGCAERTGKLGAKKSSNSPPSADMSKVNYRNNDFCDS